MPLLPLRQLNAEGAARAGGRERAVPCSGGGGGGGQLTAPDPFAGTGNGQSGVEGSDQAAGRGKETAAGLSCEGGW